jgi:hypothetical protein
MSKYLKKTKKKAGLIDLCIGVGLILAVLVPFWGWILAAGAGLIICGWYLIQNSGHR